VDFLAHLNEYRALTQGVRAYNYHVLKKMQENVVEPGEGEGFDSIIAVEFDFNFESNEHEHIFSMYLA
jgi:hypothetical protein